MQQALTPGTCPTTHRPARTHRRASSIQSVQRLPPWLPNQPACQLWGGGPHVSPVPGGAQGGSMPSTITRAVVDMSDVERLGTRGELVLELPSELESSDGSSSGSSSGSNNSGVGRPGRLDELTLAHLLATWDKAVAVRSMSMISKLKKQRERDTGGQHTLQADASAAPSSAAAATTRAADAPAAQQQGVGSRRFKPVTDGAARPAQRRHDKSLSKQLHQQQDLPLYKTHKQLGHDDGLPDMVVAPPGPIKQRGPEVKPIAVRDVMQWLQGKPPAHLQGVTTEQLVQRAPQLVVHSAMKVCSKSGHVADIERLLQAAVATGTATTYTWGTAFIALADAGHLARAHHHFERACKARQDIGPVGASTLIKLSAHDRNLDQALELYYKMCSVRTTFNRYMFNCLLHLCGVLGRVNDALDIMTHMRSEAAQNSACKPDSFTYSALLNAVSNSKRWELLNSVFFAMLQDKVEAEPTVWSLLVLGAGKAGKPQWALNFWNGYRERLGRGQPPAIDVVNAYLWALCRGNLLEEMMQVFHAMREWGVQPDSYTFGALLTAMARANSSLEQVETILRQMRLCKLKLNTELGCCLLNAYKRTPELQYRVPGAQDVVLEHAQELMREMVGRRMANARVFTVFAILHITAGLLDVVPQILADASALGCELDAECYHHLHYACMEQGEHELAERFRKARDQLRARKQAARRLASQRRAALQATWAAAKREKLMRARPSRP